MSLESRYRPSSFGDITFATPAQTTALSPYFRGLTRRPLILHGPPGGGKTESAKLLPAAICPDIQQADIMELNGSKENGIDKIRSVFDGFARTTKSNSMDLGVIIFNEADGLSKDAQDALKGEMEAVQEYCLVIMTTNHVQRIHDPIRDRCRLVEFPLPNTQLLLPLAQRIMRDHGEDVSGDHLLAVLSAETWPVGHLSYRKMFERVETLIAKRREAAATGRAS
ncbi:replication factor C small subunit [Devosia equisanguinis]|uniref:Replication factor C small subunit n=1 Tax=Devosia equisanguinis TaxID=2490941 RepID=A0A447I8Q2_9HYPH|nr:AAA family ATPase [Devosia equisanguinis]VDS03889.1 replication factor C small subunit [Devosia equisanguinis]